MIVDAKLLKRQQATWDARLAAEGLGLPGEYGDDWEGRKGQASQRSGSKWDGVSGGVVRSESSRADRRPDRRDMDLDALRNRASFRNARERQIWRLHCAGTGYQSIAKRLKLSERQVRNVFRRIEAQQHRNRTVNQRKLRRYIAEADPAIVRRLLTAAQGARNVSEVFERAADDPELRELYLRETRETTCE